MRTDKQLYKIFRSEPQMLKDLLGIDSPAPYRFHSEEFKELARRADGCFDCEEAETAYIVELQAKLERFVYHRTEVERILYHQQHPEKKVYMILIFLFPEHDPKTEPWYSLSRDGNPYFRVSYLKELLDALAARQPDHPLLLVFKPIMEKDDARLRKDVGRCHQALRNADLEPETRDALLEVFESWISLRFKTLTREEVNAMFAISGEVEDTVLYKQGREEGREEGQILGSLQTLEQLLSDGLLEEEAFEAKAAPLRAKLEALQAGKKP